jgi:hypothetical protein
MTCEKCNSDRMAEINGKCNDMACVSIGEKEHLGYMPDDLGVGGGDYISFRVCLNCGIIDGKWPLPISELEGGEDED